MITLSILLIVLLAFAIIAAAIAIIYGAGFIVVFGDMMIAALIIGLLINLFNKKKGS